MDRTETAPIEKSVAPEPGTNEGRRVRSGSQAKLSSVFLWVLLAAALFRLVTSVTSEKDGGAGGLVHWVSPTAAVAAARASQKPILCGFTADGCWPCHARDAAG